MKIMIASDIHGSAYFCRKMLDLFDREQPSKLLLLGDLLYHGPRNDLPRDYSPKQVITMLNGIKNKIIAVRGNCEAEVDQMVLDFPVLSDYSVIFDGDRTIFATHGHIYNEQALPSLAKGDILLNGHTHIPVYTEHEFYTFVNPGSVSIPKNETPHSAVVYNDGSFKFYDIESGGEFKL